MTHKTYLESDDPRANVCAAMLKHVPFEGWTQRSLDKAVQACDLPQGSASLFFPRGPLEVIEYWSADLDAKFIDVFSKRQTDNMRIRHKITQAIYCRLEVIGEHEEAARRVTSRLALPGAIGIGPKLLWATSDTIWHAIGDTSTDANYYSKRTILAGVLATSLMAWLSDTDPDKSSGRAFVDARIDNVMSFEKVKGTLNKTRENVPDLAQILGNIRYGERRRRRRR